MIPSLSDYQLHPHQEKFVAATLEHPPPKHRWTFVQGRKRAYTYCHRCGVPVSEPAASLVDVWMLRLHRLRLKLERVF